MTSLIDITDLIDSVDPSRDKGFEEPSSRITVGLGNSVRSVAMWGASFDAAVRTDPLDKVDTLRVNISLASAASQSVDAPDEAESVRWWDMVEGYEPEVMGL
jgi:hypothetical protein